MNFRKWLNEDVGQVFSTYNNNDPDNTKLSYVGSKYSCCKRTNDSKGFKDVFGMVKNNKKYLKKQ